MWEIDLRKAFTSLQQADLNAMDRTAIHEAVAQFAVNWDHVT
jgi:hypothetical protein